MTVTAPPTALAGAVILSKVFISNGEPLPIGRWRQIYNDGMATVDNAAWMTAYGMKAIVAEGSAYFVHRNGTLLGIGKASGERIDAVVSAVPGAGADVVRALAHALNADVVTVEVASTNHRAIRLYERLGFIPIKEISRWYQVF